MAPAPPASHMHPLPRTDSAQQQPAERERVVVLLELLLGLARRGLEGVEEDAAHGFGVTRVRFCDGNTSRLAKEGSQ